LNVIAELLDGTMRVAWFQRLTEQIDGNNKGQTSLAVGAQEAHRDPRP
jgi:hypothetical protein